jgi:predicted ArsR family transcriptional regulator
MGVVQEWDLSLLGTLGGALGDPTRFSIYKHVVTSTEPISAGEAAQQFGLHRTVARSHLEKLAEAGLVQVGTRRNPRGGRPAKVYSQSNERIEVQLPPRRYETLSAMLIRLASRLNGRTAELAEEVGRQFGCEAAQNLRGGQYLADGTLNLDAIIAFLGQRGCSPKMIVTHDGTIAIEVNNCLYLELARDHPDVVCGLSTGMLCGLIGAEAADHRQTASMLAGDDACVHEWRLPS